MTNNIQQVNWIWWEHFLYLEDLLLSGEKYVAFVRENFTATSITFMHIILSACADIECILKEILGSDLGKIIAIANVIEKKHEEFFEIEISVPALHDKIQPWLAFKKSKKPPLWWNSYNDIKHNKNTNPYRGACLERVIESLAGLFSVNLVYYTKKVGLGFSENVKLPKFFNYPGLEANYRITGDSYNINVPGFPLQETML